MLAEPLRRAVPEISRNGSRAVGLGAAMPTASNQECGRLGSSVLERGHTKVAG